MAFFGVRLSDDLAVRFDAFASSRGGRSKLLRQMIETVLRGGGSAPPSAVESEARARGLVNRVVPAAELDDETERLVAAILAKPREALAIGKQLFYQQREMGVAAAYQLASQTMACNMVHPVAQEGVQAFIDKREPQWPA